MVNYCQSMAFECPYLLCNDHIDRWVFQEIFFIIILYIEIILNNSTRIGKPVLMIDVKVFKDKKRRLVDQENLMFVR